MGKQDIYRKLDTHKNKESKTINLHWNSKTGVVYSMRTGILKQHELYQQNRVLEVQFSTWTRIRNWSCGTRTEFVKGPPDRISGEVIRKTFLQCEPILKITCCALFFHFMIGSGRSQKILFYLGRQSYTKPKTKDCPTLRTSSLGGISHLVIWKLAPIGH